LDCPVTDLTTKELIELCIAAMAASPDGPIKDAITACIEAGITEGGAILTAVKACIAAETDANTTTEIIAGPLPASATPPAVPTDDPEDTHIQYYADGIRTWVSDGAGGLVLQGDRPYPASCCPAPSIGNVPPAPDAAPPVTAPDGSTPNPVVTGDPATGAATHVSYWVDGSWWTCECGGGEVTYSDLCPTPSDPNRKIVSQNLGGSEWERVTDHYSECIEANSAKRAWLPVPQPASTAVERSLEYQMGITNLSDCREADVTVSHTGHTFAAYYMPGDEFSVASGDRVFISGFQSSWDARSVSWQFQNTTTERAAFEAANQGYEGSYRLAPGAVLNADIFSRTASSAQYPTIITTHSPAGTALEQMHGSMHLTTR